MRCAIDENEKNERSSSAGYVYVEGHGWINIENFLDRIKKDIQRIEQELGSKQEK